jgi:SWI/SNF-related matrix-associated actin-dependent regulator of chromatin subfamily A member 5
VIQQGRLADREKKVGKDEMLSMIQFGAEEIFKSTDCL